MVGIGPFATKLVLGGGFSGGCLALWAFWYIQTDTSTDYISILSHQQK